MHLGLPSQIDCLCVQGTITPLFEDRGGGEWMEFRRADVSDKRVDGTATTLAVHAPVATKVATNASSTAFHMEEGHVWRCCGRCQQVLVSDESLCFMMRWLGVRSKAPVISM